MTRSVAVIGGGQAGLAVGFYLARAQRDAERRRRPASWTFSILDGRPSPGGSWNDMWPSLRLFSPAASSSLPGMRMPASAEVTASAAEVVSYLDDYEARYALPVSREVVVDEVTRRADGAFTIRAGDETCSADAVVMATGTWGRPFVPAIAGRSQFTGAQLHAHDYDGPDAFAGRRVAVVGGANSGAQIAADLSASAEVTWITRRAPRYLPDAGSPRPAAICPPPRAPCPVSTSWATAIGADLHRRRWSASAAWPRRPWQTSLERLTIIDVV